MIKFIFNYILTCVFLWGFIFFLVVKYANQLSEKGVQEYAEEDFIENNKGKLIIIIFTIPFTWPIFLYVIYRFLEQ